MKTLDVINYLWNESQEEMKYIKDYKEAEEEAMFNYELDKVDGKAEYNYWWNKKYFKFYGKRVPNKTLVKDNLKKIRKLTLKLEKELDNEQQ